MEGHGWKVPGSADVTRSARKIRTALVAAAISALLVGCTLAAPLPSAEVPTAVLPSQPTVAAALTALPTVAAKWKTYTDAALGYSLSFPADADFASGTSKAGIYTARLQFSLPGVDGYQGMILRVEPNPTKRGIEQIAEEIYRRNLLGQPPSDWPQQLSNITVAGLSGVQIGQGPDFSLVVPYEDHVYIIAPVHDLATTSPDPQALALFYQVLSTLRISQ